MSTPRPLSVSLARFSSVATMAVAMALAGSIGAQAASVSWDGSGADSLWTTPVNWTTDTVPLAGDDLTFGTGAAGLVLLNGNQTTNSLSFTQNFTLGEVGVASTLTNVTGTISVAPGTFGTINANLAGANGLSLNGGGSLYLTNVFNSFAGPVNIDGAGTSLVINTTLPPSPATRGDAYVLGGSTAKTINLTNGGELKIIGGSFNPDGATKNIVLGTGGGAINVTAGYQQFTIDDAAQIAGAGGLTKNGAGRLTIGGANDYLIGSAGNNHTVNGGFLDFSRLLGAATTRFAAFNAASSITVNAGVLVPNSGTVGIIDNNVTLNGTAVLGMQSNNHEYGVRTGAATTLTLNDGVIMARDAFGTQGARNFFVNSQLLGGGSIDVIVSTGAFAIGGGGRLVLQRSDAASTFNGTFVLRDAAYLETNPRYGANVNFGNMLGASSVEFAGFNAGLDLRDSGSNTGLTGQTLDYTGNKLIISDSQAGSLPRLTVSQGAAGATNNTIQLGQLSIGNQRLQVTSAAGTYGARFSSTVLSGNASLDLVSAPLQLDGSISAPGGSITKLGNSALTLTGAVSVGNLEVRHGNVILNGANGSVPTGAIIVNGVAGAANAPLNVGALLLDNTAAGTSNSDRLGNAVPITMLGNALLRLTSESGIAVNETTGLVSTLGNPTFDVVRTGAPTAPVSLTLTGLFANRGASSVLNFTGTSLGTSGNTSRIVVPEQVTDSAFLGGWAVSGNEFAKYSATADGGVALGVTPLVAANYTAVASETDLALGVIGKVTTAPLAVAPITLSADRSVGALNFQTTVASSGTLFNIATNGSTLTLESGGLLQSGSQITITGIAAGGITAGTTAGSQLFVTANGTVINNAVIRDNPAGAVTLVKSGTGALNLVNQGTLAGTGGVANTFTGGLVINAGVVNASRGAYLGTGLITLAGGQLEINQPAPSTTTQSNLPGFGQNVLVTGNAYLGIDDNGSNITGAELSDANSGDFNSAPLGTLTINGGHTLNMGGYNYDYSFSGASLTGTPTLNIGVGRETIFAAVIGGALSGSGFNVVTNGSNGGAIVLGGGNFSADSTPNAGLSSAITLYGGTLRLDKLNGVNAIGDGTASEDVVINGGTLAWGPGHYLTNSGANAGVLRSNITSGQDQIADTATVTMLTGSLGINNHFNNEKFGTLNMKGGTLNPGLGTMEITTANIAGGAIAMNSGSTLKAGTLNLLPGAPDVNVANNFLSGFSTLEIGAGGLNMSGQTIIANPGAAALGSIVKLGGNVTVTTDPLNGNSFQRGIFFTTGRELFRNIVDLQGGVRTFNIAGDAIFTINPYLVNGGITKTGAGQMVLNSYRESTFDGPVSVEQGSLTVRNSSALGSAVGGTSVSTGGTLKIEGSSILADAITLNGAGAFVPGTAILEQGALVSDAGTTVLKGALTLGSDSTIATNGYQLPAGAGTPIISSTLLINSAAGITGTGTLTVSGGGSTTLLNGLNTVGGGLNKIGRGTLRLGGAGTYTGATVVSAGTLNVGHSNALGSGAAGTTVYGGATLELQNGISIASEALTLHGSGITSLAGALNNISGINSLGGAITLGSDTTINSDSGSLTLSGAMAGTNRALVLSGNGDGTIAGALSLGQPTAADTLTKNGPGTWTLAGANTFVGTTRVNGGTLVLDYRTQNGSKIDSASQILLGGGSLSIIGNAASPTVQSVNGINLVAGGANISVSGSGGQTATLNLGAISRANSTTANFQLASNGAITTTASPVNGILGGYATVNGSDWATITAGKIAALTTYSPLSEGGTDSTNSLLALSRNQNDSVTTNSLKISGGANLGLDSHNLTLTSGGLLSTAGVSGIAGSGIVSGIDANTDLTVHVDSGSLDIAAAVVGSGTGGLIKAGSGTLILSNTTNVFAGAVSINAGTLGLVGPGGTADALVLGAGAKDININGGTLSIVTGSYDVALNTKRLVIGSAGGTLNVADGVLLVNDAGQFAGSGTLTKTGGGRLSLNNDYSAFSGSVLVNNGILQVSNPLALGGRSEQSITLASGTALIGTGTLANNVVATGGALLGTSGGDRTFTGTLALSGTNRLVLADLDSVGTSRNMTITNRITGGGTFDIFGVGNGQAVFLTSGANEIGTMNLNANATLEVRFAGSIGNGAATTAVNLNGINSRYLIRESRDGFFNSDVVVNAQSQIDVGQLGNTAVPVSNATGTPNLFMTINDLTVNGSQIVTISNANAFTLRVAGDSTINGSPLLNVTGSAVLENVLNFPVAGSSLNKVGGGTLSLLNGANHTGNTVVAGGTLSLRGSAGGLASTNEILIRSGTLSVENVDGSNANRLNDAAPISMIGGGLRVVGTESAIGTLSVNGGSATISYSMDSQTVPTPLTLTGFNFNTSSAALNFVTENGTLGAVTNSQGTVNPRIIIPGQADVTGINVLPWAVSGNEFVQYSTALDSGVARGVITVTNNSVSGYNNDPAETTWTASIINRLTGANATNTMTANRSLQAIKLDGGARGTNEVGRRIDLAGFALSIQSGQIISVNNTMAIGNSNATTPGTLTAGTAGTPSRLSFTINAGTTEVGLTSTNGTGLGLTGQVVIADNGVGGAVSLFKNGGGNLQLRNTTSANTYTGGTYVNAGQLETWRGASLSTGTITLAGGTLHLNVPFENGTANQDLPDFGQNIVVNSTSTLSMDNNGEVGTPLATGVDHNANFGTLAINGPYTTFTIGAFDSYDASFTSAALAGRPTINMISRDAAHTTTIGTTLLGATLPGVVSGSGFELTGTGGNLNGTLVLAGTDANTYAGQVLVNGGFMRLAKPAGVTALTADADPATFDIIVNGGELRQSAADLIDARANVQVNGGVFFLGQANNQVIASAEVNGGTIATGASTTATSQMGITGDVTVTGNSNPFGGLIVDNLSTLTIGGTLTVGEYGRVSVREGHAFSPTGTALITNDINLTGSSVALVTGGNATRLRLNGNVTTNASSLTARIDGQNDSDTYLELNGTRTFTVADGAAGEDLNVSALFINSTNPVAVGGIIKDGPGLMVISNSNGAANTFSGPTTVNAGTLDLARNAGVNALGAGGLTIGDGLGGSNADRVRLRNSNQIPDAAALTVSISGVLDLELANASETVASVSGGGNILVGPNSVFGTKNPAGRSTFSGAITGAGAYTKTGVGTQEFSGDNEYSGPTTVNEGELIVNGSITGSVTTVATAATLSGSGILSGPLIVDGMLTPGDTIGILRSGNLTLSGFSTLSLELNGNVAGSLYDQVMVTGTVTLQEGDLSLALGYVAPLTDKFAIILNDGTDAVNGQFNGLSEGALFTTVDGVDFFISYMGNMDGGAIGNDVVLTIPEPASALSLLTGLGMLLGMPRFRRRR